VIVKVCRDCGEEYRPDVLRCADCGGELVARSEQERDAWPAPESQASAAEPPDPRPAGDYQPIAWGLHAAELAPLADRLVEAQIPFYLRPRDADGERASGYEIRVRTEERDAALREIEELERALRAAEGLAPAPGSGEGARQCPACGHALPEQAAECPDCGLAVGHASEE
jgi:hypothetical protein